MRWFKHRTGSHDDPDISDAWDEFGDFGYVGFFVILEIYGDEFNHINDDGFITISRTFLRRKLRKSWTKVEQLLNFYLKCGRILSKNDGNKIMLNIPNFIELSDNWTGRKLRSDSVDTTAIDIDIDKEVDKDINNTCTVEKEIPLMQKDIFISLPLNDKTTYGITTEEIVNLIELYPAVNIEQEFRNMKGWLLADTKRLKTKRGIKRFYNGWLSRSQDKYHDTKSITQQGKRKDEQLFRP